MTYTCKPCPAGSSYFKTNNYGEAEAPVQGAVNNCSFMASLISVAWVSGLPMPSPKSTNLNVVPKKYWIQFWKDTNNKDTTEFWVSEKFWMDENSNFQYGHSSEAAELWPAVYEKAYANFIQPDKTKDIDNMSAINWPKFDLTTLPIPIPPLVTLTGWRKNQSNPATYAAISAKCVTKKTIQPMIAWTKGNCPKDFQMKPNHTYAVLGVYQFGSPVKKYVILRNPLGKNNATNTPGLTQANTSGVLLEGNWPDVKDVWYKSDGSEAPGGRGTRSIPFDANLGLFGLLDTNFSANFTAYTWVGSA